MSTHPIAQGALALRRLLVFTSLLVVCTAAWSQSNLAEGFKAIPPEARILLMPIDLELFSVSGGGVLEPRADWTDAAAKHMKSALLARKSSLRAASLELDERDADDFAEVNALHAAIARSIAFHHFGPNNFRLPTKEGRLDWSMGEAVKPLKARTGADYALFTWMRDSYVSGERVAAVVIMALFGIAMAPGGMQVGYASLVDLNTGQILWFNRLVRGSGDLREADKATETLDALLANFPAATKKAE